MTIRLVDPPIDNTGALLAEVLKITLGQRLPVLFLCPAGESEALLARLRMKLSRERHKAESKGKRITRFQLRSTVHPETHGGVRYDAIVCWTARSQYQQALSEVEQLLVETGVTQIGAVK